MFNLNDLQKEAIAHTDGALLILAGAGTGKTTVLVQRIITILESGKAQANEILAVTFTNKAAREMTERIARTIPQPMHWVSTFHSTAARILRIHAAAAGLAENFTIIDQDEQEKLIKTIMEEMSIDVKQFPVKVIAGIIQRWKEAGLNPSEIDYTHFKNDMYSTAKRVYVVYQQKCLNNNVVDFGDLLIKNIEIFRKHPDILDIYHRKFKYFMVDEYQDTNLAQYLWLRILTKNSKNVCCVGDDDQSIYGWRGAEIGNILKFQHDFPDAKIIKLEENYRSTNNILNAASKLISHNNNRYEKSVWTKKNSEHKVSIKPFWSDKEEAHFIATEIRKLSNRGVDRSRIAVLVRALSQTRIIEEMLIKNLIPYKILGSLKFYEREEIKDMVAYIRLTTKLHDDLAFDRIINKPARSIGKTSIQKIRSIANENNISLFSAALQMCSSSSTLGAKTTGSLGEFLELVQKWHKDFESKDHVDVVKDIIKVTGYESYIKAHAQNDISAASKIENLQELLKALEEFSTIIEFLDHITLVTENDDALVTGEAVNIMTLHASKGLEFDTVFLPGWEEGLFPHSRSIDELGEKGLEEERRLAYVGMTRAQNKLYISFSHSRRLYNKWLQSAPSRFLKELPAECCEV